MYYEERYRPFVVTTIVGGILWFISGGFVHAFIICPDWDAMNKEAVPAIFRLKPLIMLFCMGLVFGFAIEIAKFMGAVMRSEALVLFLPLVTGALVGSFQANFVTTDSWGFDYLTIFRSDSTRQISGAVAGAIMSSPTIMAGITIRRNSGRPW